jgi:hypothetical protein
MKIKLKVEYKFITSHGWTLKMNEPHGIDIHDSSHYIEIWPFILT